MRVLIALLLTLPVALTIVNISPWLLIPVFTLQFLAGIDFKLFN